MAIDADIVASHRGITIILTEPGQLHHRAMAIQAACDFEAYLSELLSAFFTSRNPEVTHETACRDLYSDGRVLGSLSKMADIAVYLGLISQSQQSALKKFARLRNHYAHGRHRGQLRTEPELFKLITSTDLYTQNAEQLRSLDEQAVFMCIKEQLARDIKAAGSGGGIGC